MNIVGKAGGFIMKYQVQIELLLILILAAAAVFFIIRAIINAGKKRQLLSQINDTVTEINTAVTSLSGKQSDVIYIDNRTSDRGAGQGSPAAGPDLSAAEYAASKAGAVKHGNCRHSGEPSAAGQASLEAESQAAGLAQDSLSPEKTEPAEKGPEAVNMPGEPQKAAAAEETEEKPEEIPKKYFSRDCNISKNGKVYTAEELEKQIKE